MRKLSIFLILLLLLLVSMPAQAASLGLLNGSFETDTDGNLLPDSWVGKSLVLSPTGDGRDSTTANDGTYSMRIKANGKGKKLYQEFPVSGPAADSIKLTFSSSATDIGGSGKYRVRVLVFHNDGTKKVYKLDLPTGSHGWTARTINIVTSKAYKRVRVEFQVSRSHGTAWFDGADVARPEPPPPPDPEGDSETFLNDNFHLQNTYGRVLCVSGNGACPAQITTTVPCLTATCSHPATLYSITATYTTIQAASDASQPGDLIIITPGNYRGLDVEETGGAENAYIHFMGWCNNGPCTTGGVIINSDADPNLGYLTHNFYFVDVHHYMITNLVFTNAERAGIFFTGYFSATGHFSHHMIVANVYSHDNGRWGLHTTSTSYIVIQDSTFTGSIAEHGTYVSGSGDHMLIRRNVFQGNHASGFQANADPLTATSELYYWLDSQTGNTCGISEADLDEADGHGTWQEVKNCYDSQGLPDLGENIEDGISTGLIVEQNVMTGNGAAGGAAINLASVRSSTIRNNLIYGNSAGAIACWDDDYVNSKGLAASPFGCNTDIIVNNTIVDSSGSRSAMILMNDAKNMVIYNNIIARPRSDAYDISARSALGLRSGHNYYYGLEITPDSTGWTLLDTDGGSGSITGFTMTQAYLNFVNPVFTSWILGGAWPTLNPSRPDYHLVAGSVLLTAGDATYAPTRDFDGTTRTGTEVGAYTQAP